MNKNVWKKVFPITLSAAILFGGMSAVHVAEFQALTASVAEASPSKAWNFSKDIGAWQYSGNWEYSAADPEVAYDRSFGGSLKLPVDFTTDAQKSWSEVKITDGAINGTKPLVLSGQNMLSYDFYFTSDAMSSGSFKTKVYMKSIDGKEVVNAAPDIDLSKAVEVKGTNYKKVAVQVPFEAVDAKVNYMELSLVGSNNNYKGDVFINNINISKEK